MARAFREGMVLATRGGSEFTKRHLGARRLAGLLAVAVLAACGDRPPPEPKGEAAASAAVPADAAAPFVAFTSTALTIDRLEVPVPVPATVGSSPSLMTLESSAPEVVSIDAAGALVGHRAGRAILRTADGRGELVVEVRPVSAIAVVPARLTLRPGARGRLRLVAAGSGEEVPAEAARWASDAPEVALVIAGVVEAGTRLGAANIIVGYGGATARAVVSVERERPAKPGRSPGTGASAR